MVRYATKDEAEKEEEEAERLVRKSPTKKPPRRDKERERMKVEDEDLDDRDKDMSMNYKDIGGSVALASIVARRFILRTSDMSHEELLEKEVVNPETEEQVKLKSLKDKPENSPARAVYDDYMEKWRGKETEDAEEENQSDQEPEKPKVPKKKVPDDNLTTEDLEEMDSDQLYDMAVSDDYNDELSQAARDKLLSHKKPLPNDFPEVSEFKGQLSTEDLDKLDDQFQNWSAIDYYDNIKDLTKSRLQARLDGNERDEAYFEEIIEHYQEKEGDLPKKSLREQTSEDMLGEDLDSSFESGDKQLSKKRQDWYQSAMFSSLNSVQDRLSELEDMEAYPEGTKGHAYKQELQGILTEVRERKAFDKAMASDNFLLSMQGKGKGDPGDVDFTDPDERKNFMDQIRSLSNEDLIELVQGNDTYEATLGLGAGASENLSISDEYRQEFLEELSEDLRLKGFFEQVRVRGPGQEPVFDKASLLKFQEKLRKDTEGGPSGGYSGFTDFLLDFLRDSLEEAEKRYSHISNPVRHKMSAKAFHFGVRQAFRKVGLGYRTKKAQYGGLPGPLEEDDPYKPPQPDWDLPVSTQSLYMDDYIAIVRGARKWLKESYISHVLDEYDFDMACRLALDMSIHTTNDYKYNGGVRYPEYDRLLGALKKVEHTGVNIEEDSE